MTEPDDDDRVPGLDGYRLQQPPQRDLWPGIAARLPPRRPRWQAPLGYATAAALVVGIAIPLLVRVEQSPTGAAPVAPKLAAAAEREWSPLHAASGNRALVQANLQMVDDAERQIEQALKTAPDSAPLQRLLDSTRDQRRGLRRLLARPV